jgi:hypothetical protein
MAGFVTVALTIALFFSIVGNAILAYYLYKFISIIMTFEDDIADALESLQTVEASMEKLNDVKMFYEDDTIKSLVNDVLDHVKLSRHYVNWMAKRFTDRSKQRYVTVDPTETEVAQMLAAQPSSEGDEGTVLHVGH